MKTRRKRFHTLPDGTRMPLAIKLPLAQACNVKSPTHCQIANAMRTAGYRDPQVMPNDEFIIKAIYRGNSGQEYRLLFTINAEIATVIGKFDAKTAQPAGTEYVLPAPVTNNPVKRVICPNRKERRDAGMTKTHADNHFGRTPGKYRGRRAHTLKFA